MAKTVYEMMLKSLEKADQSASQIVGHVERAKAYCDLAMACAAAIGVKDTETVKNTETVKEEPKKPKEEPKEAEKETVKPAEPVPTEKKAAEPVKNNVSVPKEEEAKPAEPVLTEKWTAEAKEYLRKEMSEFNTIIKSIRNNPELGNDFLCKLISDATEGNAKEPRDVTPLNLRLIISYVRQTLAME